METFQLQRAIGRILSVLNKTQDFELARSNGSYEVVVLWEEPFMWKRRFKETRKKRDKHNLVCE